MTYCSECGKSIAPNAKFCRICGAPQADVQGAPPAGAPASPQTPAVNQRCRNCGDPLRPDEKFCGVCGTPAGSDSAMQPPAIPVTAPAPPQPVYQPPPPPQPAYYAPPATVQPAGGQRFCRACNNPIKPGDKFCSKCLVKVPDDLAAAPVAYQPPPPVYAPVPPAVSGSVCPSCRNPVTGSEKFCGVCGTPVPAAPAPAPAARPAGKFCGSCGAPVNDSTKFCGGCGALVGASFPAATVTSSLQNAGIASPVSMGSEPVIGVIRNARKMKMLNAAWDTYNIVITDRRMILAQITLAMTNAAIAEAQVKAKDEGKGFFGIMGDQLAVSFQFGQRYETMSPDQALAETPGNFAIDNTRISGINMKLKDKGGGDNFEYHEFKMIIESADGKFEFRIAEDDRFINLLKRVYGDKVRMPFGYASSGGVRIKFM